MKVVEINAVYGVGSTGIIVSDICNMLESSGNLAFPCYMHSSEKMKKGIKVGNLPDWKWHALYTRLSGMQGYASRLSTKQLLNKLDTIDPDIIHLHNLHSNYINLPMLLRYCAKRKIKTILTLHDCWFFTGKCFHFVESTCEKWKTGCSECPRNKMDIKSLFFDNTKRAFDDRRRLFSDIEELYIVGCSEWMSSLAGCSPLFSGREVVTVRNGVDTSVFCPTRRDFRAKNHLENKTVVLGMANKWLRSENKEALERANSICGNDMTLVIVGCSEEERRMLSDRKNVIALGFINDRYELADIYSSSDMFVNLTHADTLPTVNMESICCGTPVITYDVGGSAELVDEGVTGHVIPENDLDLLLKTILDMKDNPIDRCRCADSGRKKFDKNVNYLQYLKLFEKICNGEKV